LMMRAVAGDGDDRRGFRGDPVRSRVRPRAGAAAAGASAWPARSRGSPLGRMGTAGAGCRKREETAAVEVRGRRAMGGPAASAGRLVVVVVVMLMLMSGGRLGGRGAGKVRAQIENRKHLGVAEHGPAGTLHGRGTLRVAAGRTCRGVPATYRVPTERREATWAATRAQPVASNSS